MTFNVDKGQLIADSGVKLFTMIWSAFGLWKNYKAWNAK